MIIQITHRKKLNSVSLCLTKPKMNRVIMMRVKILILSFLLLIQHQNKKMHSFMQSQEFKILKMQVLTKYTAVFHLRMLLKSYDPSFISKHSGNRTNQLPNSSVHTTWHDGKWVVRYRANLSDNLIVTADQDKLSATYLKIWNISFNLEKHRKKTLTDTLSNAIKGSADKRFKFVKILCNNNTDDTLNYLG